MNREQHLEAARELARQGNVDDAYKIADKYLTDNPNDLPFLTVMTYIMMSAEKKAVAYHLAKQCTQLAPKDPSVWVNMGMAAQDLWQSKEAERAYKRGLKISKDHPDQEVMLAVNLCALYLDTGQFDRAEPLAQRSLKQDPEHRKSLANLGFCQLAQRNWAEGWKNYHKCLGHDWRPKNTYANEPEWDGEEAGRVVLYAEQGLGDVISFASMVPDAQKKAKIVLDVNAGLEGLLQRSFPDAKVYGTRLAKTLNWDEEDQQIDASMAIGQVGEFFRLKDEDFPGTPYLVPDPDRSFMWKELFKSKFRGPEGMSCPKCGKGDVRNQNDHGTVNCHDCHYVWKERKPCIGLAWNGGIPKTASKYRQLTLEQLRPILESVDAHWVSLQYKPAGKEIAAFKEKYPHIDIVEYPHATLTKDYDDTAALVSALDHCIIMQTAVGHLAGGLGIPCWTFIPTTSQWRYGMEGEDFLWANSVRLIRQKTPRVWDDVIDKTAKELNALFPGIPETAEEATRKGKLRSNRPKVRSNGKLNRRQDGDRPSA